MFLRLDRVVPLAVKGIPDHLHRSEFLVANLAALRIGVGVEFGLNLQAGGGRGIGDQVDDDLEADQGPPTPVLADVSKHAMLDLIPLARARRQVTDRDRQARIVGQALQFGFPQPGARPVAAPAIGDDQQLLGRWVASLAHLMPPAPQGPDRKLRGVMIHPDTDPTPVGGHVVYPVGHRPAERLGTEIIDIDRLGLALGPPLPSTVLERADQLLLLRIDRHDRLTPALELLAALVDVRKLGVAVRVRAAFTRLAVGLQAVVQRPQQPVDRARADPITLRAEFVRQLAHALAGPAQRRPGVAPGHRLHQRLQRRQQRRVLLRESLAPPAAPPNKRLERRSAALPLLADAGDHGISGHPRGLGHDGNAAAPQGDGFRTRPPTPHSLVHQRTERFKLLSDQTHVAHAASTA